MKNRLLKILGTLTFLFAFIIGVACINVHASWEIIPSEDGNILKIHSEAPGKLFDGFKHGVKHEYKHIVVTGKISRYDFGDLELISYNCKSIDLFDSEIDEIREGTFRNRTYLEKFVLPSNLRVIKWQAFEGCSNLKIDRLPESLESIESQALRYCEKISLTIPDRIKIGKDAFYGCPSVNFSVSQPQIKSKNIFGILMSYVIKLF